MSDVVEQWNRMELRLRSSISYEHPDTDVSIVAEFRSDTGSNITLSGFWDGGDDFAVRFAPTELGRWTYTVAASDETNRGLNVLNGKIDVIPYSGDLDIYRHGFVRVSDDGRGFAYADGTPFFWLGDTHRQAFNYERLDESNDPHHDCVSQFRCVVDADQARGFTVYQTYPDTAVNDGGGNESLAEWWTERFTHLDPAPFRDRFDVMMNHLADRGVVIALGLGVHTQTGQIGPDSLSHFAKYVTARYAAYPVVWITGQEVDIEDEVGKLSTWRSAAQTIADTDGYHHPLGGHMWAIGEPKTFAEEPWHDWYPTQGGHTSIRSQAHYKSYWDERPTKPFLETEANYEDIWDVTTTDTRQSAWMALQCGSFGYTYGVAGVWAIKWDYDSPGWDEFQNGIPWFEGIRKPGGTQMTIMKDFYLSLGNDWRLTPRFGDPAYGSFVHPEESVLASDGHDTYVVYFYAHDVRTGELAGMTDSVYAAWWLDPRTGSRNLISDSILPVRGRRQAPCKPDISDWVLLAQRVQEG